MHVLKRGLLVCSILMCGFLCACGNENAESSENKGTSNGSTACEEQVAEPQKGETIAIFHMKDLGDITVRFFEDAAPKAVENFVTHAKDGYFDGITFHRVINEFMIQGGDPTGTGRGGESIWGEDFENEQVDYLLPIRGSLCMSNAGMDTNGSQFFIVQATASNLNSSTSAGLSEEQIAMFEEYGGTPHLVGGYTVFGQVIEGMDIVDKIASVGTDSNDRPIKDVVIESMEVTTYE